MKLALATLFVASATLCLGCGGASSWVAPELRSDAQWWIAPGLPQSVLGAPWDGALARVDVGALTADPTCRVEEGGRHRLDQDTATRAMSSSGSQVTLRASRRLRVEGCAGAEGALQLVELYAGAVVVTAPGAERQRAPDAEGVLVHAGWEWHVSGWRPGEAIVAARFAPSPQRAAARCDGRAWADAVEPWLDAASATALLSPTPAAEAQTMRDALGETLGPLLSGECTEGPDASASAWLQRQSDTPPEGALADVASAWVVHALEAHDGGRYVDAIEALDRALDRRPDHAAALLLRARLVRDVSGRLEAAHDALDAAPEGVWSAVVAYERGLTSLQAGSPGLALKPSPTRRSATLATLTPDGARRARLVGRRHRAREGALEEVAIDLPRWRALQPRRLRDRGRAARAAASTKRLASNRTSTPCSTTPGLLRAVGGVAAQPLSRTASLAPEDREIRAELEALATGHDLRAARRRVARERGRCRRCARRLRGELGRGARAHRRGARGELTATELTFMQSHGMARTGCLHRGFHRDPRPSLASTKTAWSSTGWMTRWSRASSGTAGPPTGPASKTGGGVARGRRR